LYSGFVLNAIRRNNDGSGSITQLSSGTLGATLSFSSSTLNVSVSGMGSVDCILFISRQKPSNRHTYKV
jgi:hypothetical protein